MGNTVKSTSVIDSIDGNVDFAEAEKLINFSNVSTVIIHIHNAPEKSEGQAYAVSEKSEKMRAPQNYSAQTASEETFSLSDALAETNPVLCLPYFIIRKLFGK